MRAIILQNAQNILFSSGRPSNHGSTYDSMFFGVDCIPEDDTPLVVSTFCRVCCCLADLRKAWAGASPIEIGAMVFLYKGLFLEDFCQYVVWRSCTWECLYIQLWGLLTFYDQYVTEKIELMGYR